MILLPIDKSPARMCKRRNIISYCDITRQQGQRDNAAALIGRNVYMIFGRIDVKVLRLKT